MPLLATRDAEEADEALPHQSAGMPLGSWIRLGLGRRLLVAQLYSAALDGGSSVRARILYQPPAVIACALADVVQNRTRAEITQ